MKKTTSIWILLIAVFAASVYVALPCMGQDDQPAEIALADMSIDDLCNVEVTTTNKTGEKLLDSAAAVYVITGEDIRRMGSSSIAEALRLVPGVQVGRVTSNKWSIGARGFCDVFSNKLLVLMDGRSVYSPLFAGVLWDVQDTMLEDIDRIEVIRGPGAALWGANAVNGVVNIITKSAAETGGKLLVYGTSGGDQKNLTGARIGTLVGNNSHLRVYAKGTSYGELKNSADQELDDAWYQNRSGFRFDYDPDEYSSLTLMGNAYNADADTRYSTGEVTNPPFTSTITSNTASSGSNILMKWSTANELNSRSTFQFNYDHTRRIDPAMFGEDRDTYDFDYQRESHNDTTSLVWGFGYRHSISDTANGQMVTLKYKRVSDNLYSFFFQNDRQIKRDKLKLILGAKLEHNDYTNWEYQPNARLVWTPSQNTTVWGAVSKAVRTPSIADFYSIYNITAPPDEFGRARVFTVFSNPNMESEKLTAYELGCRFKPSERVMVDLAGFMNFYEDLRSMEPGAPYIENTYYPDWQEHLHYPLYVSNNFRSNSQGLELTADYVPSSRWRLRLGASMMNLWLDRSRSFDVTGSNLENTYPKHQVSLASFWDVSSRLTLDAAFFAVGSSETPSLGKENLLIPAYNRLDFRVAYRDKNDTEWALGAKNATDSSHFEAGSIYGEQQSYIGRSFYLTATKTF